MPTLTRQSIRSTEPSTLSFVALDGSSDAFPYNGGDEILILQNTSGGDVTVTLKGDQATKVARQGITEIDVSSGKSVVLAANTYVTVSLKDAYAYLTDSNSTPAISGGTADIMAALIFE